ncbi:calmodulin-like protein 6 [Elaeis guineensis]|uniref:Calmodulin-like protein 3 n=1 Tax=Elaeis guineensis var. tenera TaxID=51953 RepID=A0A6I9QD20_ELAGV|nr:calmodulin-like protein 3 [Elaeis guineensis]
MSPSSFPSPSPQITNNLSLLPSRPLLSCPVLLKLTMTALLLFAILFTCGLINSVFFFHPSKLLAWLCSILRIASFSPKPKEKAPKKDDNEVVVSKVTVEKPNLETIFATFDRDGDGFITAKELEESFKRLGMFSTRNEIMSMMERVDTNGDGLIDLEEFRELYDSIGRGRGLGQGGEDGDERVERGRLEEEEEEEDEEMELRHAFDVFDENGDGLITVEELGLVLASLGLKRGATVEDCRDMIRKVDLDGDGMVNFEEFKKMMKGGKVF